MTTLTTYSRTEENGEVVVLLWRYDSFKNLNGDDCGWWHPYVRRYGADGYLRSSRNFARLCTDPYQSTDFMLQDGEVK